MGHYLLLFTLLFIFSCGNIKSDFKNSADVFILKLNEDEELAENSQSLDCRERISQILCIVDPLDESNAFTTSYNRPCLEGSDDFLKIFQTHYDQSHSIIKKMYCSLEKIWIENELSTTAYASPIFDQENNLVAAGIGIKKDFLLKNLTLSEWLTHKEKSSYGNTGTIKVKTKKNTHSALHFALNHEFGHILDYANKINKYEENCNISYSPKDCLPTTDSWSQLSWKNGKELNHLNDHPLFQGLCFYQCGGEYLSVKSASLIYTQLMKSNFTSTYATLNAKEDWAETFAFYLATYKDNLELLISTEKGTFDISTHYKSNRLKEKRAFIEKFLKSSIIYPGQSL